jgi:hypothetical protein
MVISIKGMVQPYICKASCEERSEDSEPLQPQESDIIVRGMCQGVAVDVLADTGANVSLASIWLIDQIDIHN